MSAVFASSINPFEKYEPVTYMLAVVIRHIFEHIVFLDIGFTRFHVIAQKHSKIRLLKNFAFFVVVVVGVVCSKG